MTTHVDGAGPTWLPWVSAILILSVFALLLT